MTRLLLRNFLCLAVLLSNSLAGWCQNSILDPDRKGGSSVRNSTAVLILESAVSALGGASISQVRDCVAEGTSQVYIGHAGAVEQLTIENFGSEYRYQGARGDIIVSGHGKPIAEDHTGKRIPLSRRTVWGNISPHLVALYLYAELTDLRYSVLYGGSDTVGGRRAIVIMSSHPTGTGKHPHDSATARKWFIDASSYLPLKIEYIVPSARDGGNDAVRSVELSNFKQVNGVLVPFQFTSFISGQLESTTTLHTVKFNVDLPASEFDISGGER